MCPNGDVLPAMGLDACVSMACHNGAMGECKLAFGDWDGQTVLCAKQSNPHSKLKTQ